MKNKIIIFTDLDGSLLNTQNFKFDKAKSLVKKIVKGSNFIIPNSSKTELEIKNFIKKLKIKLPFISENGSEIHNLNTIERKLPNKITMARNRKTILKIFFKNISKDILMKCDFLYQMNNKKKSRILGLKGKDLNASSKRKFTYPFVFKGDKKLKKLLIKKVSKAGLSIQQGGRVMNLGDNVSKGTAIKKTINFIKSVSKKKIITVGVGDNQNDLSMFKVVKYPCIVSNRSIKINNKNKIYTNKKAPEGWIEVVKKAMDKINK